MEKSYEYREERPDREDFFASIGRGDREGLLALVAEDIEWIIPGKDWPLAGTRHGHAGLADLVKTQSETIETSLMEPREFVAQGDRVLVVGFARGKIKATGPRRWMPNRKGESRCTTNPSYRS
jgi:ketosteroid isomerase-like protein